MSGEALFTGHAPDAVPTHAWCSHAPQNGTCQLTFPRRRRRRLRRGLLAVAALALLTSAAAAREQHPLTLAPDGSVAIGDEYLGFITGSGEGSRPPPAAMATHAFEASTRERVRYDGTEAAGTIVIDTSERRLYFVQGNGSALRYQVGVGREGFGWHGTQRVSAKRRWPDWRPPSAMIARRPDLPRHMPGGPDNPLGAGALYLGDTLYRIHGSNDSQSVGQAASSGCFRMRNADLVDLYDRVRIGARVVVL